MIRLKGCLEGAYLNLIPKLKMLTLCPNPYYRNVLKPFITCYTNTCVTPEGTYQTAISNRDKGLVAGLFV